MSFDHPAYHVPRTTGVCARTGRELSPGEPVVAALIELTDDEREAIRRARPDDPALGLGLRRIDVAAEAWEAGDRPGPEAVFSYWKTAVPEPNAKPKLFVDDASLLQLLVRLEDAEGDERVAFRFVLALILLRKKLLRFDGSETRGVDRDGVAVPTPHWVLVPKLDPAKGPLGKWDEDRPIAVINPELTDERVAQVTEQLGEVLASGV